VSRTAGVDDEEQLVLRDNVSRLGLGTVQFGLDYGITNSSGRVPQAEVSAILSLARAEGVSVLDTAALYGDSEAVLGQALGDWPGWRVVTKTAKFGDLSDAQAVRERVRRDFARSLARLSLDSVYGLIIHDADDLLGRHGSVLWEELVQRRAGGVVAKIGASVYSAQQIEALLNRFEPDLIQLPFSAVDQRLARCGMLAALHRRGVEIHARSVFLQGLLLAPPHTIDTRFGRLRDATAGLQAAWRDAGLTALEGALAAVFRHDEIDHVIVGVSSIDEFRQVLAALHKASQAAGKIGIEQWSIDDDHLVNPANWGRLERGS
jgi:aryl-alcohol dehydrogenase-like predicted oxidoreductase